MSDRLFTFDEVEQLISAAASFGGGHRLNVDANAANLVPYFEQYMGLWAMYDMESLVFLVERIDLNAHLQAQQGVVEPAAGSRSGGEDEPNQVGIIPIRGTMMKHRASMREGTSTVRARRELREMAADGNVGSILLHIDSPGGTVAGTSELAADIRSVGEKKPVVTYFEDMGASAAYWAGSQSRHVFANSTASVGGIGTFGVVYDAKGAADKAGIKVHVIRAGEFKGMGTPGTEVTEKHLAHLQEQVNQYNQFFLNGVEAGREALSMKEVESLADGRTRIGESAKTAKLIDDVMSFDEAVQFTADAGKSAAQTTVAISEPFVSEDDSMSATTTEPTAPVAATIEDLRAACPGAPDGFLLAQLEAKATIQQAQSNFILHMQNEREAERKQAASTPAATATAAEPAAQPASGQPRAAVGTAPVPVVDTPASTPAASGKTYSEQYRIACRAVAKANPDMDPFKVQEEVEQDHPGLRLAMLKEVNGQDFAENRPDQDQS